ncbi:ATP-binding protein [Iodobacter fluviatilis]|uniref:histidine kinase n=1 Tax=Iodobacter fluviatilis TaxID=537 RepID=A0A377QA27_9NEIS|nr:ATP-binding protein [Iodobacter fluviatilis]TCU81909.1 signal transduction histidine kinase [Iodobacter fluviatilis]STQ91558.1 Osmolarity sensor protein EnvZ [Iodobacter fluviatilis]
MRYWPKTLFGQILLVMLAGLFTANAAGVWLVINDRARLARVLRVEYVAEHIASSINVLGETPAAFRTQLLRALNSPALQVSLDTPWQQARLPAADVLEFEKLVSKQLQKQERMQVVSMSYGALPESMRSVSGGLEAAESVLINLTLQAQLEDGTIVTFSSSRMSNVLIREPWRIVGWLALVALAAALLSVWAVRRLTQPLSVFSTAAEGLARNINQPPLPETGPKEVRHLARAFNSMQCAIKLYLSTRSQMLAGISHDLRLPITRIRLRLEKRADPAQNQAIERDLEEMENLIADTLAFLHAGNSAEASVKLNFMDLLEGVVEDIEALGAQISVRGQACQVFTGRPQALRRCLSNLLDNARRYGGNLIILTVQEDAAALLIMIEDQGDGIEDAELERVFEPYVRLETSRSRHTGGSGLGLAIARAIARTHGGEIWLANRKEGGLKAMMRLPFIV